MRQSCRKCGLGFGVDTGNRRQPDNRSTDSGSPRVPGWSFGMFELWDLAVL